MGEVLEVGTELRLNPYVTQMEKLSDSLKYLSGVFRNKAEVEAENGITAYELDVLYQQVQGTVCKECHYANICELYIHEQLKTVIEVLFLEIEEYGVELSIKKKRELEKRCYEFDTLKEAVQKQLWTFKNNKLWEARIAQSQDASLLAMQAFVDAVEESTKEIDASIFHDERMERKIASHLKRLGVRTLKVVLFVSEKGRYEVHISAKARAQTYITNTQIARMLSGILGKRLMPERKERLVLKERYTTIIFVERPRFQIISAASKQVKDKSEMSGDNFLVLDIPSGKTCALISDGMGSGVNAYKKSKILLELAEKLLEAGISSNLAIQMMNAALITEVNELEFATLDLCMVDVYRGEVELTKAGAAGTYVVTPRTCEYYEAASLPIGVVASLELNCYRFSMKEDCYIVMVTDGVSEVLKGESGTTVIERVIHQANTKNPKELAAQLLQKVLELQNGIAKDDMMVLVLGVWELQFS